MRWSQSYDASWKFDSCSFVDEGITLALQLFSLRATSHIELLIQEWNHEYLNHSSWRSTQISSGQGCGLDLEHCLANWWSWDHSLFGLYNVLFLGDQSFLIDVLTPLIVNVGQRWWRKDRNINFSHGVIPVGNAKSRVLKNEHPLCTLFHTLVPGEMRLAILFR